MRLIPVYQINQVCANTTYYQENPRPNLKDSAIKIWSTYRNTIYCYNYNYSQVDSDSFDNTTNDDRLSSADTKFFSYFKFVYGARSMCS